MDLQEARISALSKLIGAEQIKDFAQRYGLNASYLSQLLNGHRELGEKSALSLEERIGLPPLSLCYPQEIRSIDSAVQMRTPLEFQDTDAVLRAWPRLNEAIALILSANPSQMTRAAALLASARDDFELKLNAGLNPDLSRDG